VEQSKYAIAMEGLLKDRFCEPGERILRYAEVILPLRNTGGLLSRFSAKDLEPQMMVITSKRFLIMEKPKHGILTRKCGHCPPESFCPVGPGIAFEHDYSDISRVIRGVDSQMFVIGWVERGGFANAVVGETRDIFVCHRSDVRREVVETLSTLTGPDVEYRVEPQRDMLIKQTSDKRLESATVCMNFAYRCSLIKGEYKPDGNLFLYILSETQVCEVAIKWEEWIPPFEAHAPDVSDDEGEEMKLEHEYDAADPSVLADENVKVHKSRLENRPFQTNASEWLTGGAGRDQRPGMAKNSIWRESKKLSDDEKVTMKVEGVEGTMGQSINGLYQEVGQHENRRKFQNGKCVMYFKPDGNKSRFNLEKHSADATGKWYINHQNSTSGHVFESLPDRDDHVLQIPWTQNSHLRWKLNSGHADASAFYGMPIVSYVSKAEKTRMQRKEAIRKDADRRGATAHATEPGAQGSMKQVQQNLMRKARTHILESWNNWPIEHLNKIEFVAGENAVLQLTYNNKVTTLSSPVSPLLTIHFLDDVSRERWRRGLAYILNKSDTAAQWQRKWVEQLSA
jgi:hypothetical protein